MPMWVSVSHGTGIGAIHGDPGGLGGRGGTGGGEGGAGSEGGGAGGSGACGGRGGSEGGDSGSHEHLTMGEAQSTYVTTRLPRLVASEVTPSASGPAR